ncbi:hypothetical protein BZK31_23445 [Pseudomonas floridensis]|uniref:Uncharacterized protein n=1 Tax=Pseudomonas floridensis TaxID=1958950 RepID=A0A1X0N049_9PSED|nr:hypothetical protein [Pseudomonas floridensis]ORC56181.1 hypothetical protein BZK31_23445 [Pseudomonas floridensis]
MMNIPSIQTATVHQTAKSAAPANATPVEKPASKPTNRDGVALSALARQLNESAVRAQSRDASLGFKELGTLAKDIIDRIAGSGFYANRERHDAEVPDTDDPVLLERARQATLFERGSGKNPFAGLSPDQLRLIMYDESGSFTINERSAAFDEEYSQDQAWKRVMIQRYMDEYNETGKGTQTLFMILAHYNDLPPIEKAQYPAFYPANLTSGDSAALALFNGLKSRSTAPQLPSPST